MNDDEMINKDRISEIVELMNLNYHYLTEEEKKVCDKVCVLDQNEYQRLSFKDLETMQQFVPVLSEKKAKSINWSDLEDDAIDFSSVGCKNLDQIIGMSSSDFIDRKTREELCYHEETKKERDVMRDSLNFLDFYVRFANNSVSEEEFLKRIEDLANKVDYYSWNMEFGGDYKYKDHVLRKISVLLKSENRIDKVIGLEKFINFSHFVEPSVIPHVFGCRNSSGLLQSSIIHVLNELASSDITELSDEKESVEKHKWVLERNSEHRRKKISRKNIVQKRHIFRKNIS
jgi:hypothetical protein